MYATNSYDKRIDYVFTGEESKDSGIMEIASVDDDVIMNI